MSIVLSHSTALQLYRAPARPLGMPTFPQTARPLKTGAPQETDIARARTLLASYGVPDQMLETIDVLVSHQKERRRRAGVRCHVCAIELPPQSLVQLDAGIFAVDPRFCALLAAQSLSRLELVEYYYELCGSYALPFEEGGEYRDAAPLANVASLESFFRAMNGSRGATKALWAARYTRDGSRSPMETATTMTLILPKRLGGLGIRGVRMDRRIAIAISARRMTRRGCFYADVYIESARLLIEYMGMRHEEERRQVEDGERDNALDAMGYHVVRIWRWALFDKASYRRILEKICVQVGLRASRFPPDFADRQEELRRFVLRAWLK